MVLVAILMGVNGCMGSKANGHKPYEEVLLAHLQNKYGEIFEYVEPYLGTFGNSMKRILVVNELYPDEHIVVGGLLDDDGNVTGIQDNYMAVRLKKELIGTVLEIARHVYGEQVIIDYRVSDMLLPDTFDRDTHFAEYTSSTESSLNIGIIIGSTADVKKKETDAGRLRELLEENMIVTRGVIIYCKDINTYETLSGTDINPYWSRKDWYLARGNFSMTSGYEFMYLNWR